MSKIAIAISTRNRPKEFAITLANWQKYKPKNAKIFIVDDNSDVPYCDVDFRFETRAGIPKVKNKCLELAYDYGADFIFLSDDDCYPKSKKAVAAYIDSGCNHLSFSFPDSYAHTRKRSEPRTEGNFNIHEIPNGCMLFFTRQCVEKAGGFDQTYGLGTYEHADITRRIYRMGLTNFPNMDIVGSEELFHSMDKEGEIERSFSKNQKRKLLERNRPRYANRSNNVNFIPFR